MTAVDERLAPRPAIDSEPWYAPGLRFQCSQCGNCCTGPPGFVWFSPDEARELARHLGVSESSFYRKYARRAAQPARGWSLKERRTPFGLDCVFLDRDTVPGRAVCSVYEVRPTQCQTWPFWPENLRSKEAWREVKRATPCPGMDHGPLIRPEQIRIHRDRTPRSEHLTQ